MAKEIKIKELKDCYGRVVNPGDEVLIVEQECLYRGYGKAYLGHVVYVGHNHGCYQFAEVDEYKENPEEAYLYGRKSPEVILVEKPYKKL